MRDTLSTNREHLRVAEVKSFPAIPKSMRSVNGYRNGANLKKWSVLLVCTIRNTQMCAFYCFSFLAKKISFFLLTLEPILSFLALTCWMHPPPPLSLSRLFDFIIIIIIVIVFSVSPQLSAVLCKQAVR